MDSSDCIISPEENQTKVCTSCREDLPLSAFYRQAKGRFGRRSQCKECEKGYFRQWQSGNESRREYMRNYLRNYVSENKERLQEKSKEYYQENGQRIRDRMKDYYLKNTEEIKERVP